jgi:ATP-dependent Clp protease ATP-binding subunit ClpC
MFERFTDRARTVIVLARDEARELNHDRVGTEHLLLGLLGQRDVLAAKVLASLGITDAQVRERVGEAPSTSCSGSCAPPTAKAAAC